MDLAKCDKYKRAGASVVGSAKEVAEAADVILSGLPNPTSVRAMFADDGGLLEGLSAGKIWVDHSTTDFGQTFEFEKAVKAKGADMLEAPVSGGLDALMKGQMAVFGAGDRSVYDKVKPVLEASFSNVMYTGGIGTAMIPKVMSNMLCCVNCLAMGEILMIAKRSGLDLTAFWHAIRASAGNSFTWETAAPNVFAGDYHKFFDMGLQTKDIQLMSDIAKASNTPIEFLGHMQRTYDRALAMYGKEAGCYVPPKMLEEDLKESLRAPGFEDWTYDLGFVDGAIRVTHKNIKTKMGEDGLAQ